MRVRRALVPLDDVAEAVLVEAIATEYGKNLRKRQTFSLRKTSPLTTIAREDARLL